MKYKESLGEHIAYLDEVVKNSIEIAKEKENNIIKEFFKLKELKENIAKKILEENNLENILLKTISKKINDEYDKKRTFLLFKKQSKQKQCDALIKLLEYLNTLNKKEKEIHIEQLLLKHKLIEEELLKNYKDIY
tara:strand:- start:1962 stop:2366 length:405 start_codon:yes stop_codon:yes gene_type:complete